MSPEIININNLEKSSSIALGIDFGTTNSLIGFSKDNSVKIVKHDSGNEVLKSIVCWDKSGNIFIDFKNEKNSNYNYIYSIKRFLGKSSSDLLKNFSIYSNYFDCHEEILDFSNPSYPKINLAGKKLDPYVIASYILAELKRSAEQYLNVKVQKIVISIPAYFDNRAKAALLYAAELAELEIIRLVAEPTAAAYAYNLHTIGYGHYIVYDLGGGTFDISILNIEDGILHVLNVKGDNLLGGDDIDQILLKYFFSLNIFLHEKDAILKVRKIKETLSYQEEIQVANINFTREKIEELIAPLIDKTIKLLKEAVLESDITKFNGIILVGGSTKIPYVKNKIIEQFPDVKIYDFLDPDQVVAMGSSIHAEHLTNSKIVNKSLLIDAIPLSIGIELYGGLVEKIIPKNTPLPYAAKAEFTTFVDNQTAIKINVFQGERELVQDCIFLGSFELENLEPKPAGHIKMAITFHIDINGILYLIAKEKNNFSKFKSYEINIFKNLNQNIIDQNIEDSYQNAQKDFNLSKLYNAKFNAMLKIKEVQKFLFSKNYLEYLLEIKDNIRILHNFIEQNDYENIVLYTDLLDQAAITFLQKIKKLAIN